MKTFFGLAGVVLVTLFWNQHIDTSASRVNFTFINKNVKGTIGDLQSASEIDLNDFTTSTIKGSVGVTTLDTDNFLRDGHLMWSKYFNRKKYPRIHFNSTKIEKTAASKYKVTGELTLKGTTKTETFIAEIEKSKISITGTINIVDYDIRIQKEKKENEVTILMVLGLN